jgi:hypothetical protein
MKLLSPLLMVVALMLAACDYSIVETQPTTPVDPGTRVSIVVTPGAATVAPDGSRMFRAIVTGSTDTTVTWSMVSGPGAVSASGVYTASEATGTAVIRARSNADTTKAATATITVARDSSGTAVSVSVSPSSVRIFAGTSQQFTANVTGTTDTGVTWSFVAGPGSLSPSGMYSAPQEIPSDPTTVTIRATSVADPNAVGFATITVIRPDDPNRICFDRDIRPILVGNCTDAGCHNSMSRADGYDFTTTRGILRGITPGNSRDSEIYESITEDDPEKIQQGDRMPRFRDPLPAAQIDLIRRWIEAGADTTACAPVLLCDSTSVTYSGFIRPTLETNCRGCHTGGSDYNKNVDVTTYEGVQRVAQSGQLLGAISHAYGYTAMPFNAGKLDDCTIAKFRIWISKGAPND